MNGLKDIEYNNEIEYTVIKRVFENRKVAVSSRKSMLSYTMGAALAIEALSCCLAIKNDVLAPATLNVDNIEYKFTISLVKKRTQANFKVAMKLCCDFAGFNSAAIFKSLN
ncbi:MAG: hypothetical protein NG737_07690 [Omnitrophica bacterium]|nr:hypothetical protein [Candidatus Omnitrophota bacterium]